MHVPTTTEEAKTRTGRETTDNEDMMFKIPKSQLGPIVLHSESSFEEMESIKPTSI